MSTLLPKAANDELVRILQPIARDLLAKCVQDGSAKNPDQVIVGLLSGLSAYLSTIGHNGHSDQAYRAALSAAKSVPNAVIAANVYTDKMRKPHEKLYATMKTASGLIKRAAWSCLPDFTNLAKRSIGNDIDGIIQTFTFSEKNPKEKRGSGLFGAGIGDFHNSFNTDWLEPDDDTITGGAGFDLTDYTSPFYTSGNFSNSVDNLTTLVNPGLGIEGMDTGGFDSYSDFGNFSNSTQPDFDFNSTQSDLEYDPSSQCGIDEGPGLFSRAASGAWDAVTWLPRKAWDFFFSGNHLLGNGITTFMILPNLTRILGGILRGADYVGTKLFGSKSAIGKSISSLDKENYLRRFYNWAGKHISQGKRDLSNYMNKDKVKRYLKNLDQSISLLLPALGQDYLAMKRKKQLYEQQKKLYDQAYARRQEEKKDEVARFNAELKAKNREERTSALMYNSDQMAKEAKQWEDYKEQKDVAEENYNTQRNFVTDSMTYDENMQRRENKKLADQYRYESEHKMRTAIMNALSTGITRAVQAGTVGATSLNPAAVGVMAGVGGVEGVVEGFITGLNAHSRRGEELHRLALQARHAHNDKLADDFERKSIAEFDAYDKKLMDMYKEANKSDPEKLKAIEDTVKAGTNVLDAIWGSFSDEQRAKAIENLPVFAKPIQGAMKPIPIARPDAAVLRYVPEEIKDDDPRLKKYYEDVYAPPVPTADMFNFERTAYVANNIVPQIMMRKFKKKKIELPEYVNPMPLEHVSAARGTANTLRTNVVPINTGSKFIRPVPARYSYAPARKIRRL